MNVLHITPTFYPATYWGGPIYSVYGLCNALVKIPTVTLKVLTTDASSPRRGDSVKTSDFPMPYPEGYNVYFCRRWWGDSVSPTMFVHLWPMIRWADVVHLTAVYSPPTIPTLLVCRLLGKPVVWSPRGALQRWEGSTKPMPKRAWERFCNALITPNKCKLHVTSKQEAVESEVRILKAHATIIPNGVEIPASLPPREWLPDGRLRILYIGRLHPKKGIENLIRALAILKDETVTLTICGSGDTAYLGSLQKLTHQLLLDRCVFFAGHVDGENKVRAFMLADLCIVPSFTENFGMVVAEALAHAVPVIVSQGTPWAEVETRDCGLWVNNSPDNLASAICCIRKMTLPEMGKRGREWMKNDFSWACIAEMMFSVYSRLVISSRKSAVDTDHPIVRTKVDKHSA